ncbi:MAG: acetyl-CoA hydrolase [Gemmatimonadetes bacterium]|nr:acetyl-CoA hydrolase [Gemmatimonadota bacterium]
MKTVSDVADAINRSVIPPGSVLYTSGNAATPRSLLGQLASDLSIKEIDLYSVLLLGEGLDGLFSTERCQTLTHRVIFNGALSKEAVNRGSAKYHPVHLSEIPRHLVRAGGIDAVLLSVSGPDPGGNYSLGTTVEAVLPAIEFARAKGGTIIAERNAQMPFVLGSTIPESYIDYLVESDYSLPASPVREPDERAVKIAEIIAALYIEDGSGQAPGSTLQYGIGEVPEAVTAAILRRGVKDLAIHTELFSSAMARLIQHGVVSNRWKPAINCSISSIFLAEDRAGYGWLHFNSAIQSRSCDYTNSVFRIADQPRMVAINGAMGVDLHGNIWADSLQARKVYSGVGGQADFIRGAQYSEQGVAIIALKSTTVAGVPKIVDCCPAGITTTAIAADQVIIVTEYGAFDPRGLSLGERAVGIAHLAHPDQRSKLLRMIHDNAAFHRPDGTLDGRVPGFIPHDEAIRSF